MIMEKTKLGIIGLGNMGGAIAEGLSSHEGTEISGFDPDVQKTEKYKENIFLSPDCLSLARESDYIILAVKPHLITGVVQEIYPALNEEKCLISIAAGTALEKIVDAASNTCPVVRVMPNTPALVGQGVFALCLEHSLLRDGQISRVKEMFARLGQIHILAEKHFDSFTALIGSGPAYVYYFLESLIEAGVTAGISREQSTDMVKSLVSGSLALLGENTHVTLCKEAVSSPGGTTITGLNELDRKGVRSAFIRAVLKARERSRELGKN